MNTFFFYKIAPKQQPSDLCYIGKTKDPKARMATHKSKCMSSEIYLYRMIRENGGWDQWKFQIIETQDMEEAQAKEREQALYHEHQATLNGCEPNGHPKATSYYQQNKETMRIYYRNRYTKKKTEWKRPKLSSEDKKVLALRKAKNHGHIPTQFTMEKHSITSQEVEAALAEGGW